MEERGGVFTEAYSHLMAVIAFKMAPGNCYSVIQKMVWKTGSSRSSSPGQNW